MRKCSRCGAEEHPAVPFAGGLCDVCRAQQPPPAARSDATLSKICWVLCAFWVIGCACMLLVGLVNSESSIHQATYAAVACFAVISAYILCRAVDGAR